MKLKLLYSLLLATTLVACTDDYTDWAAPQHNDPETPQSVLFTAIAAPAINFANVTTDSVTVFTPALTAEEGVTATYKLILDGSQTLNVDSKGQVLAADLNAAVVSLYGKRPVERIMAGTVVAYADVNGQVVKSTLATELEIKVTLVAPQISSHYYIIGAPSKWEPAETSLMFNHSGKDVYEDPVFTIVFPVANGEVWFAITDDVAVEKNDWPYVFGCVEGNGTNGMEGSLARRSELKDDGSWKIVVDNDASFVKVTINMMEYSYKIEKLNFAEYIYEVGNNNNWGNDGHPVYALQGPAYDGVYHGAMYLKSGFKFRSDAANWDGSGNWGLNAGKDEGVLMNGSDSGNIELTEDGFYKMVVNLVDMTYSLTPFTQLGIIGDGQPGGWDTDTPLTYDETEKCWVATNVQLTAGKSIKFRTIGNWDIVNIGGVSLNSLVFNSNDNIPVSASGTFTVKLFLETQGQPYATLVSE